MIDHPISISFVAVHGSDKFLLRAILDMYSAIQEQIVLASKLALPPVIDRDVDTSELLKEKVILFICSSACIRRIHSSCYLGYVFFHRRTHNWASRFTLISNRRWFWCIIAVKEVHFLWMICWHFVAKGCVGPVSLSVLRWQWHLLVSPCWE